MIDSTARFQELLVNLYAVCSVPQPQPGNLFLTAQQVRIMRQLELESSCSLKDLAKAMGVSPATMSVAVEKLVKKGVVVKERFEEDARVVHIRLTGRGDMLRRNLSPLDAHCVATMLETLGDGQRDALLNSMEALVQAAEKAA